jgi:Zeta toxin
MRFKQYLQHIDEGINDKGIFKAIFVVGVPGAGKSYTISKIKGVVSPQVINTDRASEYLAKKLGVTSGEDNWSLFKDSAHRITVGHLAQCLNGMLPLFVDGTSSDVSNILARVGILESMGYDVGCVFVDTDLQVAIDRAERRAAAINRTVPQEFIKKVHSLSQENKQYLKSKFSFFKEARNNPGELDDEALQQLFTQVQGFFTAPLKNPVGIRALETLKGAKEKYLAPSVFSDEEIKNRASGWYRSHRK